MALKDLPPASAHPERPDAVGLGEVMVLFEPLDGDLATATSFVPSVAGAEFNACAAIASLGGSSTMVTRVGADPFASRIASQARRLGVGLVADEDVAHPTGVFFKQPSQDGTRSVHYYRAGSAASRIDRHTARRVIGLAPRAVLVSGLTAQLGVDCAESLRWLARAAHDIGSWFVMDANLRASLGTDRSVAVIRDCLPHTRILVLGADEAEAVFGTTDPLAINDAALGAGCGEVVVKDGGNGSFVFDETGVVPVPAIAVDVVDTVGAGDAYTGSYLWARLHGIEPGAAAIIATRVAARVVAALGDTAGLPTPEDRPAILAGMV